MKVELWNVADVKPYPGNPRQNEDAVDAVAASIKEFGFRQPIVVDGEGVIVCGHTRYKAALKLGLEKVPVHVARDLSPEQVRAYRISDNRTAELSDWNYDLLPLELSELQNGGADMAILGWDLEEIERMLAPVFNAKLPEKADGKEFDESVGESVHSITCPKCGNKIPV